MYLLPIEIYLLLVLVIPVGLCFAKWKNSSTWLGTAFLCAVLSWIYFILWMNFDPPDNGLANAVYLFTGWFWLLPIFLIFVIVFRLFEIRVSIDTRSNVGRRGFQICWRLTVAIVIWNFIGRMSAGRAIQEARRELKERSLEPSGREMPVYAGGHWVIRYPDTDFGEIRLTRNGGMSWIGGPG